MSEGRNSIDRDAFRSNLVKYTRMAFQMLPEIERPSILDIGCGTGIPTLELAILSGGHVTGVDIDQSLLDKLVRRSRELGVSERVRALRCSMLELDFPDESFDVIWAEGSIRVIGFEQGLKDWKRFVKSDGYLVIHDESKNVEAKTRLIAKHGYHLVGHFEVSHQAMWKEYYEPLEREIENVVADHSESAFSVTLDKIRREINSFKKNPNSFGSIFFVLQNIRNTTD